MALPESIIKRLSDDYSITIDNTKSVSGGSINRAYRISTNEGDLFLKYNSGAPDDFFKREADGLALLNSASTDLRVPDVIASCPPSEGSPGFLVIEFINKETSGDAEQFGAALAGLHRTTAEKFGLNDDNYIGSLPQSNRYHSEWTSFLARNASNPS